MKRIFFLMLPLLAANAVMAQIEQENRVTDSLYIKEIENKEGRPKVLHAEPLYIDLIRDLGARKGEREWNVGLGLTDKSTYDEYTTLVEYEWAPADRLGLEVELPFSLYYSGQDAAPGNKLNSLKMAIQYSFFVSEKISTSMAIGYIQEFELTDFNRYHNARLFTGNVYNPFFIAAKRWGQNFHTLIYAGPQFIHHFDSPVLHTNWQINTNVHYMIPGTRNFVGIEFNKDVEGHNFDMTIRPQMRVSIADNMLIGIATGIPINRENERMSTFLRLIYEPGHNN
jgi:hypothetical protein